jgi:hypothetical protein
MSENDKSRDGEVTIDYVQLSNLWPIYVLKCLFSSSKKRVPKKSASNIIFQRPGPSSKHCNSRPMGPKPRLDRSLRVTSPCIQKNEWKDGCPPSPPLFAPGSVSKPCTPGEHQNRWWVDVHSPKNGINRYWYIPTSAIGLANWDI